MTKKRAFVLQEALQGALDIIAENISTMRISRRIGTFYRFGCCQLTASDEKAEVSILCIMNIPNLYENSGAQVLIDWVSAKLLKVSVNLDPVKAANVITSAH